MHPFVVTDSKLYSSRMLSKHPFSSEEGVQLTLRTQPCFSLSLVIFTACAVLNEAQLAIIFLNTAIASCLFKVYPARRTRFCTHRNLSFIQIPFFLLIRSVEQLQKRQFSIFYKKNMYTGWSLFLWLQIV